ncbi:YdcF family protein [Allokutzneria sp. A3M-2-11 16]|uniref:YdcF family protein n=1 Tax=Allokutzneria sp. A3M-2-11 16 TaxID=2962043 RepID=UPI0020B8EF6A|nr:YdcF family protein [Allokutzneria sp. A3M-2-11 16]MCP3798106.1 YdcF family protein [Allokutzneria sp. A3M-2-11 16]
MEKYSGLAMFCYVVAGLWFVAFLVGFVIDRRRLRNGAYLVISLGFLVASWMLDLAVASPGTVKAMLVPLLLVSPLLIVGLSGFLMVNGIVMLWREGWRLANLLSLLLGIGILCGTVVAVFAMAVAMSASNPLARILVGAAAGGVGYIAFAFGCFLLYSILYARVGHRGRTDFIVVLGAGLKGDEVPAQLAGRLDKAREVAASFPEAMIIVSGGRGPGASISEARAMADYLISRGVPSNRVVLEEKSRTTLQNLIFSGEMMAEREPGYRCVVVTSNYHVLRAAAFARRAKVTGHVVGAPIARYFWPSAFLREFVAILVDHKLKNGALCLLCALFGTLAFPF